MKQFLLVLSAVLLSATSCSRQGDVTGNVASQLWAPVAYADITVQGTNVSSKTDIDGNFSINANIGDTLVISLPGYRTTKAVVNSDPVKATLNYNLKTVTVNEDNTITFKYAAPKAKLVQVCGNFFQLENGTFGEGIAKMEKDDQGLWTYTTVPTKSELYRYEFIIDGNYTIDAAAPYTIRDGKCFAMYLSFREK